MRITGISFLILLLAGIVDAAETLKFDFGPAKMEPAPGWVRLSNRTRYNKKLGYGWTKEWSRGMKWPSKDPLLKGGVGGDPGVQEGTLLVDLPDGVYKLTIQAGSVSPTEGRKGNCLEANGKIVIGAPGMGGWGKLDKRTVSVVVEKGQLKLRFFLCGKGGSYRLSLFSLVITPVEPGVEADKIKKKWKGDGSDKKVIQKKVTLNGKSYTELEYIVYSKPGTWAKPFARAGGIVFSRPNPGEILNYTVPGVNDVIRNLSGFACAGERQAFHFGIYALKDLNSVNVKFSDLRDGKKRINAENIKIYTVTCHYQSLSERPGKNVKLAPELLEKNLPFNLTKEKTQPLYAVIEVPAGQKAGLYRGKVTLNAGGRQIAAFDLKLNVLPITLLSPPDKDWQLCADTDRWWHMSEKDVKLEIADMAKHGITGLKTHLAPIQGGLIEKNGEIVGADFGRVGKYLEYAYSKGINKTLSLAATNALLWSLQTWKFSAKNGGTCEIVTEGDERFFKMKNPEEKSVSAVGMNRWNKVGNNQKLEFSIKYRNTSRKTVRAELLFFDQARRRTYKTDKVLYLHPTGDKFATTSGECVSHQNASQFLVGIRFTGKGELTIADISLKAQGSKLNLITNSKLLRNLKRINFNKQWPEYFVKAYEDTIKANVKATEKLGFQCFIDGTDEAGNNPKTEKQEISELRYARRAGGKTWCNLSPALAEKTAKDLDAVCFYADLFGNEKNGCNIIKRWQKAGKKVYFYAAGAYPGQDFSTMPNRYNVGFFFWKSRCDGTAIWTFMRFGGDPYDDLDSRDRDHCIVYPPRKEGGEAVPTIVWEGIGEGRRDFNYMYTLEQAVKTAKKKGHSALAQKGRMILDFINKAVPWYNEFGPETFDSSAANSLRWLAAWGILEISGKNSKALQKNLKSLKSSMSLKFLKAAKSDVSVSWCPLVEKAPVMDGKLTDAEWKKATVIKNFKYYMNKKVKADDPTEVYLMHDRDNLYLGFKCFTKDMGKLKSRKRPDDGNVFADDSIEMFFNNSNDKSSFYQLCFNAAGSKFDLEAYGSRNMGQNTFMVNYGKKQIRNSKWNGNWQVKTSRFADRWEAEVAIPFKTLNRESDIWGILFGRNNRAAKETTSSKAIGFFDQPEFYPQLAFAGMRNSRGRLKKWKVGSFCAGPVDDVLKITGLVNGKVEIKISGQDSKIRKYHSENTGMDQYRIKYKLLSGDKKMSVQVSSDKGLELKYDFPLNIPVPLKLKASRQVFFGDAARATVKVISALSKELAAKGIISMQLRSGKRIIATKTYNAAKGNVILNIPLKGLSEGFYTLTVELKFKNNIYFQDKIQLMLVPGY